jgi:thiamine-phosphate pyrophosphorylase
MFRMIAVTNRHLCKGSLIQQIERIARIDKPDGIILREKDLSEEEYRELAKEVLHLCEIHQMDCILHTYSQVAMELGCRRIHLPLGVLQKEWKQLHHFHEIGVSIHSMEEAKVAVALGASYLTAGHIYATECKKGVPPRGLDFLEEVCSEIAIPVYGIGGIQKENLSEIRKVGASGACIMSGFMTIC